MKFSVYSMENTVLLVFMLGMMPQKEVSRTKDCSNDTSLGSFAAFSG